VLGTSGWIQVPPRFHDVDRILLHRYGHDPETIDARLTGAGYTHELVEVSERVAGGHTMSEIMPAGRHGGRAVRAGGIARPARHEGNRRARRAAVNTGPLTIFNCEGYGRV